MSQPPLGSSNYSPQASLEEVDRKMPPQKVDSGASPSELEQLKDALEAAETRCQEEQIHTTMQIQSAYEMAEYVKVDAVLREAELESTLQKVENEFLELKARLHTIETEHQSLSQMNKELKKEDVTILHRERRKRKSFSWKQQLLEEIEDNIKLDQAMDNMKIGSGSPKEDEKSGLLENNYEHGSSTRSISLGMKPEDKTALSPSGSSNLQQSSPGSQSHPLLSLNINNSPPQASKANASNSEQVINAIYGLGRSISSSGYYRYSGEEMPKFYAALDKRSNSTSEFSRFPRERMPKNNTIVD